MKLEFRENNLFRNKLHKLHKFEGVYVISVHAFERADCWKRPGGLFHKPHDQSVCEHHTNQIPTNGSPMQTYKEDYELPPG